MKSPDRFCPRCGAPLAWRTVEDRPRQVCTGCGRVHYRNAKPCAGALVVRDGRVLLVRRGSAPYKGWWDVPGGFLEPDEHPAIGAAREVREETGLEVRPQEILAVVVDRYGPEGDPTLNIFYLAEVVGGSERPGGDAKQIGWFGPGEIPRNVAFRNGREALKAWVERLER
ncbi:MAG TPA: NUDIX hydrolase [Chloroflexota bacterium]